MMVNSRPSCATKSEGHCAYQFLVNLTLILANVSQGRLRPFLYVLNGLNQLLVWESQFEFLVSSSYSFSLYISQNRMLFPDIILSQRRIVLRKMNVMTPYLCWDHHYNLDNNILLCYLEINFTGKTEQRRERLLKQIKGCFYF